MATINISQDMINRSRRHDVFHCAVVRAIRKVFPDNEVQVGYIDNESDDYFAVFNKEKDSAVRLSEYVRTWIRDYDKGWEVSPISFEMVRS